LVKQRLDLRAIINIMGRRVDPDVQCAPESAPAGSVLLDQPLAGPTKPQAGAVHQQVNGSGA
jgi:hypothetical protein